MQVAVPPPPDRLQAAGLKLPAPLLLKLTVPAGVLGPLLRKTDAVHVLAVETSAGLGRQVTEVVLAGASPTAKSPSAAKPVARMLVSVRVPTAGDVQPLEYLCTMKRYGSAPPIKSPGVKLKMAS